MQGETVSESMRESGPAARRDRACRWWVTARAVTAYPAHTQ